VDRCLHRPTPSKPPYRPFAAAWRRRRIATASPAPQRGYHGATTRLLRELLRLYEATSTRLLRGYYVATTRLLRDHYQATTRLLRGYHEATTRLLPGAARTPLGQQHSSGCGQHRSSAGAAHASIQLGAGADDPHTKRKERSRGGRSPHAEQAGQLRRPSTPHLLVQQDAAGVQPSLHSELADEDEHVTASRPGPSKWNMMELFMTDRHQHLPAATMLHVLDSTPLRHSRTSQSNVVGQQASSRRAAAAARRSARGPHAARSGSRARTAATSGESAATHRRRHRGNFPLLSDFWRGLLSRCCVISLLGAQEASRVRQPQRCTAPR
jgi:hypothetical protein